MIMDLDVDCIMFLNFIKRDAQVLAGL